MAGRTEAVLKSLEAQAEAALSAPDEREVAQAFELIFKALGEMKTEYDSGDEELKKEIVAHVAELRAAINGLATETDASVASMRKLIGSLVKWRESQDLRTTDTDIQDAVDRVDEISSELTGIRATIKEWKLKHGEDGDMGPMPDHEWDGTKIRFEDPDGNWGEWVDLRGAPGSGGGFSMFGTGMGGVRRIRAGAGITITGDEGEPTISATGGGGSTTTLITEKLAGVQSGNDVLLDFSGLSHVPTSILNVCRQGQVQAPAASAPADGSSAVNITGTSSARVYNADAASETYLVGYGY